MKIRFLELAERELDDAVAWYDSQSYGLGTEFLDEVDQVIRRVATWPLSGMELGPGIRRCLVKRFPYGIIYGIDSDIIIILAVAHLHREPRYWLDRTI
ncbi:MAG: type II toxin-antitoxin system RelE/ParE family toxin [Deltaproteobacteria bacterium]|nr:type II toxin-antitoxin system RelE/ParE family toxin [Deltaproteobacteria bacterium]